MKTKTILNLVFIMSVLGALVSVSAQPARGLLLTVNSSADAADAEPGDGICLTSGGECTLRSAIDESNAIVGGASDVIIFDLPKPAVIDLTLGELLITGHLEIVGPGARRLIVRRSAAPGTPNFRIIHATENTNLTIRGISIQNGNAATGGGIYVESTLTTTRLFDSALTGNQATDGGGVAVTGKLSMVRCLIAANTAAGRGGAVFNGGSTADTRITSSTITGNSASTSGAIENEGSLLLINDTIGSNSALTSASSILNGPLGTIDVLNTIIGRDAASPVPGLQGSFRSAGNNIVTSVGSATGFTNGVNGDLVSQNNAIDPMLGDLANNGGQTDSRALLAGSPAIDGANICTSTYNCSQLPDVFIYGAFDQRHFWRRLESISPVDIGAFESDGIPPFGPTGVASTLNQGTRYAYSPVVLIDPTTLKRYYKMIGTTGNYSFTDIPYTEAFVVEIRAKRIGAITPQVFGLD